MTPTPRTAAWTAFEIIENAYTHTASSDAFIGMLHEHGYEIRPVAAPPDALREALRHYDERIDPERSTGEMSAREWRDAYFALARVALKELEQARAAVAAAQPAEIDVEVLARAMRLNGVGHLDPHFEEIVPGIAAEYARLLIEREAAR